MRENVKRSLAVILMKYGLKTNIMAILSGIRPARTKSPSMSTPKFPKRLKSAAEMFDLGHVKREDARCPNCGDKDSAMCGGPMLPRDAGSVLRKLGGWPWWKKCKTCRTDYRGISPMSEEDILDFANPNRKLIREAKQSDEEAFSAFADGLV